MAGPSLGGPRKRDALAVAGRGTERGISPSTSASSEGSRPLVPRAVPLPGRVTALATGEIDRRDGLPDIIVGVDGAAGPRVLVFESPKGALEGEPEVLSLTAAASASALEEMVGDDAIDL